MTSSSIDCRLLLAGKRNTWASERCTPAELQLHQIRLVKHSNSWIFCRTKPIIDRIRRSRFCKMSSLGSGSISRIHNKFRPASNGDTDAEKQVSNITPQGGKNYNEPKKYGIISAEEWKRQAFKSAEASSGAQSTATATESGTKKKKKKKTVVSFSFEEEEAEDLDINFVKPAQKEEKLRNAKMQILRLNFFPTQKEKRKKKNRGKKYDKSGSEGRKL